VSSGLLQVNLDAGLAGHVDQLLVSEGRQLIRVRFGSPQFRQENVDELDLAVLNLDLEARESFQQRLAERLNAFEQGPDDFVSLLDCHQVIDTLGVEVLGACQELDAVAIAVVVCGRAEFLGRPPRQCENPGREFAVRQGTHTSLL
jgi:hypothetical protein